MSVARAALLATTVMALGIATPLRAQSTLSTTVDTTRLTVGDRMTLTVTVEHDADAFVAWPDSLDLAPFELLDARIEPMRTVEGQGRSTARFSLTTFELGDLELPGFDVTVLHPDGREERLGTDAYGVEVVSVGVDETGDIREIRGPVGIPLGLLRLGLAVLLVLVLAAAAWVLWRRLRTDQDAAAPVAPGPPPRPPHEVALEALDALEASPLLAEGRIKEFHIRVAEILRRYVEGRYRVRALEMTTWEVLDGLASAGLDAELRDDVRRFLDQCDLVKFAKAEPGAEASRRVLQLGRSIVERSMPEEAAVPAGVAEEA